MIHDNYVGQLYTLLMEEGTNEEILVRAYRDYEKSLLKRSFYKINDRDLSDDLVQNTFLKMWEYLQKDKQIDHVRGFLFHILNLLIIDEYRKKKQISLDQLSEGGFQVEIDNSDSLIDKIDGKAAVLLIPLLEDKYKKVVSMRFEDEKTIKEIAESTQQLNNTVVVQIRRGIDKLAILLKAQSKNKA